MLRSSHWTASPLLITSFWKFCFIKISCFCLVHLLKPITILEPFLFMIGRECFKHWRSQGKLIVVYLDDRFDVQSTKLSSEIYSSIVRSDLPLARVLANEDKSVWVPVLIT